MNTASQSFVSAYKKLNPDQKQAVDAIDGPVMVLAGPGTGKTQVLSLRIARILQQTDTSAASILALTFTDAAASEMRARLISLIGSAGYAVTITTFHAFCVSLIKEYPEYFPIAKESEPITELERSEILHSLFETMPLETIKPINQPLLYVPAAMKAISDLKREGIDPEKYAQIIRQSFASKSVPTTKVAKAKFVRDRDKNQELLEIYTVYERILREKLRYDYEDMILFVLRAFLQFPEFLQIIQERFLYVLVDEYQDTNTAQNSLVQQLASFWGMEANVFVVGDPQQAIYRFQGASLENTYQFLQSYPKAKLITLKTGYRCPQPIYDAAYSLNSYTQLSQTLPQHVRNGLLTKLLAVSSKQTGASAIMADSQQQEYMFIVKRLHSLLEAGVLPQEIAVLCRTNKEVHEVAAILLAQGIACSASGGESILEKTHIVNLLIFFQTLLDLRSGGSGQSLFSVLSAPWLNFSRVAIWTLTRQADKQGITLFDFLSQPIPTIIKATSLSELELVPIIDFIGKLKDWGVSEKQQSFPDWFTNLLSEMGYLQWLMKQPEKFTFLVEIQALSNNIKQLSYANHAFGLQEFVRAIAIMRERNIRLEAEYLDSQTAAIEVTTAHKAKGREWQYVFVIHSIDGVWGNAHKSKLLSLPKAILQYTSAEDKAERLSEERRLFYVALTRAKKEFVATYSQKIIKAGKEKLALPSQFLTEMKVLSQTKVHVELGEKEQARYLEFAVQPKLVSSFSPAEKDFFVSILSDFRLSVTALNKYLKDPEEFVSDVLLRLPKSKQAPMAFGSAIHKALEFSFRGLMEKDKLPTLAATQQVFISALERELLSTDELDRRIARGKKVLAAYYQVPAKFAVKPLFIERFFGSGFSTTMLGDIALSGRIDRVDWIDEGKKLVRVVDYKTGRQRSVAEIEGKTQSAGLSEREQALPESIRGPYKRQLLFYKLLANLDDTFHPIVAEGVFEFVEPNNKNGKIVTRFFDLSERAVQDLAELIQTVMKEIRSLNFLNN